jgi:hypothetical protein
MRFVYFGDVYKSHANGGNLYSKGGMNRLLDAPVIDTNTLGERDPDWKWSCKIELYFLSLESFI